MNHAAETVPPPDGSGERDSTRAGLGVDHPRRAKCQASVRPLVVIVLHILGEDALKVAPTPDQRPVQAFLPGRPYPALGDGVGSSRQMRPMMPVGTVLFG